MMVSTKNTNSGTATSPLTMSLPNFLLRLEALSFFIGAIALYASQGFSGVAFVLLLLVPDVSMVGYMVNTRVGSQIYDVVHTYALPLVLIAFGLAANTPLAIQIGLIWFAHISMDRVVGYGLKYATDFKDTHLQHV
jgi:hypothetical protein